MGKGIEELADSLMHETLVEAATTFFGARKSLEDEIEAYTASLDALEKLEKRMLARVGAVHYLLIDRAGLAAFFDALDVRAPHLEDMSDPEHRETAGLTPGLALTRAGRYAGLLAKAYHEMQQEVDIYLHGQYYDAPDGSGRKLITPNYTQVHGWCERINTRIEAVNRDHSPSGTLCFVKGLDPAALERQRLAGGTFSNYCSEIDEELKFQPVQCLGMHAVHPPDLPPLAEVKKPLKAFAKAYFKQHAEELTARMAAL